MNQEYFAVLIDYLGPFMITSFVLGMILGGIIIGSVMYKGKVEEE